MQKTRHILSIILIAAMLLSGLPLFSPEDASRDNQVDLQDAILWVKDFVRTVDSPVQFTASVEKVLSTLNVVAGLKTTIRKGGDVKSGAKSVISDFCLISSNDYPMFSGNSSYMCDQLYSYSSADILPEFPPPRCG
ncbi:hypothetical protein QUF80_08510 [Desulfococcaceae bacterium HSG8]|nr:hypothetical protein [Desulfococcaceae bacterium HSG8]